MKYPQKRFFRQRAHSNPFSDHLLEYPKNPDDFDWNNVFESKLGNNVDFIDLGCGYGGLLVTLSELFPDKNIVGLEIRHKVFEFVKKRITALREEGRCMNVGILRTNAMKFLPNFFKKGQISKIFILFPDPHFKTKKHKARILNLSLIAQYGYFLKIGGLLYIATDVEELFNWMTAKLSEIPIFRRIEPIHKDSIITTMTTKTEESMKVVRKGGCIYYALFERISV